MKLKKILSMLLAVVMVASAVGFAVAETAQPAATGEPAAAETQAADTTAAYTPEEMMTAAMADAYARQAAIAAYAQAFPDSRAFANTDLDTQIVLLEMLLKANGVALPQNAAETTVPATVAEAYEAALTAESNAADMYRSYLADETLAPDARIIFRSVLQSVRETAYGFARQARIARSEAAWEEMMANAETKTYTLQGPGGYGTWTLSVYTNAPDKAAPDDATAPAGDATAAPEATPEATATP